MKYSKITKIMRNKKWFHFSFKKIKFKDDHTIFLTSDPRFIFEYDTKYYVEAFLDIQNIALITKLRSLTRKFQKETGYDAFEIIFKKWGQDEESAPADVLRLNKIRRTVELAGYDSVAYMEPAYERDYETIVIWDPTLLINPIYGKRSDLII